MPCKKHRAMQETLDLLLKIDNGISGYLATNFSQRTKATVSTAPTTTRQITCGDFHLYQIVSRLLMIHRDILKITYGKAAPPN